MHRHQNQNDVKRTGGKVGRKERGERERDAGNRLLASPAAVLSTNAKSGRRAKKRYTLDRRLLRLAELASESEEESFGTLEHHQAGEKRKDEGEGGRGERELLFLLCSCLSCIILEFLLIVTRCIENCKSTPWIMFLPRDREESAVRLDSGGNSRMKEVDGRKTSRLDYLDNDGS